MKVTLQFLVKPIHNTLDLFLETVFFYPESQFKQTWIRTELLMVKNPLYVPLVCHVQCVDVYLYIDVNHRAALTVIRADTCIHTQQRAECKRKCYINQQRERERRIRYVCCGNHGQLSHPHWWADGHLSLYDSYSFKVSMNLKYFTSQS